jgi:hypothetical protein
MDRIYVKSFLKMSYSEQLGLVEKIRTIRSSALNEAKVNSNSMSKTKMKQIAKKTTAKQPKDITKKANAALAMLTPEQIELIKKQFANKGL